MSDDHPIRIAVKAVLPLGSCYELVGEHTAAHLRMTRECVMRASHHNDPCVLCQIVMLLLMKFSQHVLTDNCAILHTISSASQRVDWVHMLLRWRALHKKKGQVPWSTPLQANMYIYVYICIYMYICINNIKHHGTPRNVSHLPATQARFILAPVSAATACGSCLLHIPC